MKKTQTKRSILKDMGILHFQLMMLMNVLSNNRKWWKHGWRNSNGEVSGVGKIHLVYAKDPEENIIEIQTWE
jgi:hypothetical protein